MMRLRTLPLIVQVPCYVFRILAVRVAGHKRHDASWAFGDAAMVRASLIEIARVFFFFVVVVAHRTRYLPKATLVALDEARHPLGILETWPPNERAICRGWVSIMQPKRALRTAENPGRHSN